MNWLNKILSEFPNRRITTEIPIKQEDLEKLYYCLKFSELKSKLLCYSQPEFNKICETLSFVPEDGPNYSSNFITISIIGTPEGIRWCQNKYNESPKSQEHYFKQYARNNVNLEFDDISEDTKTEDGYEFHNITKEQAAKLVKELETFFQYRKELNVLIHCRAGKSRSQAIVRYILDTYPELYGEDSVRQDNKPDTPNYQTLSMLKQAYRELKGEKAEEKKTKEAPAANPWSQMENYEDGGWGY